MLVQKPNQEVIKVLIKSILEVKKSTLVGPEHTTPTFVVQSDVQR